MIHILSQVEPDDVVTDELITKLFIVQVAQINRLEDELVTLVVASECEHTSHTTCIFNLLQKKNICAHISSIRKAT